MKLLMTTDTVGGVWTFAIELARALLRFDVRVGLATMGAPLSRDQRSEIGALPHVTVFESAYKLCWMDSPWHDVARAGDWLISAADQVQPDVVHLNDLAHGALPWAAPVLMTGHSCVLSWFDAVRRRMPGPEWATYRTEVTQALQAADLVTAPTRFMLNQLDRFYGPFRMECVIPNGRNRIEYVPALKEPFILASGRLWDEAKNIAAVAQAAERVPWPVYVAGEQQHPDGGAAEFAGLHLLGQLPAASMAAWYRQASIFVHPARYEPFGLSVLEAALSGCALVLGDIPSLREIWGDAAEYVDPDDPEALAATVNRLIAEPARLRLQAAQAEAVAARYSPEFMAESYHSAYESLLMPTENATSREAVRTCDS